MKKFLKIFMPMLAFALISACTDTGITPVPDGNEDQEQTDQTGQDEQTQQPEQLGPGPDFVSQFQKHVALWEFTGAWCANCPAGYTNLNFTLTAYSKYTDCVHMMAFHSDIEGKDELAIDATDQIMIDMNVAPMGFPSYVVDMDLGGSLVESVMLKDHLDQTMTDNPCYCGVAVSSELADGQANVAVKLMSEVNASWRIGVYVVEDKVKYYQKDGMREYPEYTHRHVVRQIASASYKGDRIGGQVTPAGTELLADYKIAVDTAWNLDNTYIYVLALDSEGHVNNVNHCAIDGGNSDYNKL